MQLLEPERGFSVRRVAALGDRIKDGLLHDNKVVPAVLAVLTLLIFTWVIAGALIMGGPGDEEEQQASNQVSLSPEDSENEDSGTPAPGVENRDTESFAAFKPKDPFRQLIPKASETTKESTTSRSAPTTSRSGSTTSKSGDNKGSSKSGGSRSNEGGEGFTEQASSGGSSSRASSGGRGAGEGGDTSGGSSGGGGGTARGGNTDLFNSGGDLPVP